MNERAPEVSPIEFARAYQAVRQFERRSLGNLSQTELDVLVELYRNHPAPQMMKVLALSAHCAESTLRGVVASLMKREWVMNVDMLDSRSRYLRLTREGHLKLRQYCNAVEKAYALFIS